MRGLPGLVKGIAMTASILEAVFLRAGRLDEGLVVIVVDDEEGWLWL